MFDNIKKSEQQNNQPLKNQPVPELGAQAKATSTEGINKRVTDLREKGIGQGKKRKTYTIIGIILILFFVNSAVIASYFYWSDVVSLVNTVKEKYFKETVKGPTDELIILDQWKTCDKDEDCVETQQDCCSCNNGGERTAINKQFLSEWQEIINNNCQNISCLTFINCKEGDIVCQDNKCEFKIQEQKSCAQEGEFVNPDNLKGKTEYPDVCCPGLKGLTAYMVNEDGSCEPILGTPYLTCTPCGNDNCDYINE